MFDFNVYVKIYLIFLEVQHLFNFNITRLRNGQQIT